MSNEPDSRPLLCYVTDRRSLSPGAAADDLAAPIRHAVEAGIDWIQIREKDLAARDLFALVQKAVAAAAGKSSKILVNDRLDVALAAGAAGVHLGGDSAPIAEVVRWCRAGHAPAGFLIGASCHSLEDSLAAESSGADYIFFGPVFATPSKLAFGPPQGIARLAEVARGIRIPVLAIGGITAESARECMRAGASGVAAIRLFQESKDLPAIVASLRSL